MPYPSGHQLWRFGVTVFVCWQAVFICIGSVVFTLKLTDEHPLHKTYNMVFDRYARTAFRQRQAWGMFTVDSRASYYYSFRALSGDNEPNWKELEIVHPEYGPPMFTNFEFAYLQKTAHKKNMNSWYRRYLQHKCELYHLDDQQKIGIFYHRSLLPAAFANDTTLLRSWVPIKNTKQLHHYTCKNV